MLAVDRIAVEHEVVEEIAAQQQADQADAGINQHACRHHRFHQPFGNHAPGVSQAVDQRIENDGCGNDHARLEAAARTEVAVKLDIEREDQDEGQEYLRDNSQHEVALHFDCSLRGRRRRSSATTPAPAVNTTVVSPSVS